VFSWAAYFTLKVSVFTQKYKWLTEICGGNLKNTRAEGVNPRWTSIPSMAGGGEILLKTSDTTETGVKLWRL